PAGGQFDHQDQGRHRTGTRHFKTNYRDARRQHLGGLQRRARLDLHIYAPGQGRTAGEPTMSKLILAVEDQEDNMQILRDLLVNAGYEMLEAENGEEALAVVVRRRPDLIL